MKGCVELSRATFQESRNIDLYVDILVLNTDSPAPKPWRLTRPPLYLWLQSSNTSDAPKLQ